MTSKTVTIRNQQGLHARPAVLLAQMARQAACDIVLHPPGAEKGYDAKSFQQILAANLPYGASVEILADGPGEEEAVAKLSALIEAGFGLI